MSNVMWHVALKPGATKMQDVIVADMPCDDFATICFLLKTNNLKGKVYELERGGFLIMYGGEYHRPFPSVMIWSLEVTEEESLIINMSPDDAWILKSVWRHWLIQS